MPKPTEPDSKAPQKPVLKPVDDPLAQLVDQFSDEVEPVAIPAEDGEPSANRDGEPPVTPEDGSGS